MTGRTVGPPVIGRDARTVLTLDRRPWGAETTLCDLSSVTSSCVGLTTGGFRAPADGATTPPAAAAANTTTPVHIFSRAQAVCREAGD
jgi:hypothetical protein